MLLIAVLCASEGCSSMKRRRGELAACGKTVHGKPGADGDTGLCMVCLRPIPLRPGSNWRHIGKGPYWAALGGWLQTVKNSWTHERDLSSHPPQIGECVCARPDCVWSMYTKFIAARRFLARGRSAPLGIGQSSPLGRFPTLACQVSNHNLFFFQSFSEWAVFLAL